MSVIKNKDSKKVTQLDSNVFQISFKNKSNETEAKKINKSVASKISSYVLKAGDLHSKDGLPETSVQIEKYTPKNLSDNSSSTLAPTSASTLESMKNNLKDLNDLQARLRFVLSELEEFIKE